MAAKGRKPLPTALKVLEGDRGKGRRPINKNEPTPPQDNVKCPDWLLPEAKKEWKRLGPSLVAMGILTDHDMEAFAGYFQNAVRLCTAGATGVHRHAEPENHAVLLLRVWPDACVPRPTVRQHR